MPVPDTGMVNDGLEAFEVIVRLPLAPLPDCGVKLTLKLALCPGVSVTGVVMPLSVKPAPLIPTSERVRLEPPVLLTVSAKAWLLPTCTLPKARLVGLDPSAPSATLAPPPPPQAIVKPQKTNVTNKQTGCSGADCFIFWLSL